MLDFVDKLDPDPNATDTTDGSETTESSQSTETSQSSDDQASQSGGDRGPGPKTAGMDPPRSKQKRPAFTRRR